jgi:hypothetical protein
MSHQPSLIAEGQITKLYHNGPSDIGWQIRMLFAGVGSNVLACTWAVL